MQGIARDLVRLGVNTFLSSTFGGIFSDYLLLAVKKLPYSVSANRSFLVGEKGPEMFVPSRAGTIIPNNQLGGGGLTNNIVVNVDVNGGVDAQGGEEEGRELGRLIAVAVQSEIIQQKSRGIISIMATFPDIKPSYGARKTNAPDFRVVRFADGYEHRIIFGLPANQNPKLFNFTWNVSESDADTIEDFLDARGGTESFDYTPAGRVLLKICLRDLDKNNSIS